ncbi:MAG TPA: ChaN family lipoprotein [Thiobacillaceae bacterium]|nr:ChaN family lipoprotein [Thiobacillaceae bacterium]HNU64311.1 ChaN family lipoprotein [Thiobacillaceae bacterium]
MTLSLRACRLLVLLFSVGGAQAEPITASSCGQQGDWVTPLRGGVVRLDPVALLTDLARHQVVLLGERHDSAEDHRWQLHTLARLQAYRPRLAIALEMLPRRLQGVLDRWVAGELSETAFLAQVEWRRVWGFDPALYLPMLHFARMHRLPLLAVNVERSLVDEVGREGWQKVPEERREGVGTPAPPTPGYLEELRQIHAHHPERGRGPDAFARFVEAQTVWDRAMAQGMADYLRAHPDTLVVGILGAGHVRSGHGVAHQLKALGVERVAGLMTWDLKQGCMDMRPGLADALFLGHPLADNPPRLGIAMGMEGTSVLVSGVQPGSVAERAGLRTGDRLLEMAGRPVLGVEDVRGMVQRQVPGTWLPLRVRRGDGEQELVARFPLEP